MGLTLVERERQLSSTQGFTQGFAEGLKIGIALGIRQTLLTQVVLKFGPLDARVEQEVMDGSDDEVDGWVAGILTAPTLDALLGTDV